MAFSCPYAIRFKVCKYIGCKKIMQEGTDYNIEENQLAVMCPFQRYCINERRTVNTDGAKNCKRLS